MDALLRFVFQGPQKLYQSLPKRHVMTVLICSGLFIIRGMGLNFPSTFIYSKSDHNNHRDSDNTIQLHWSYDSKKWSYLSFLLAYLTSTISAGFLTCVFPAHRLFGVALSGATLMQILLPTCVNVGAPLAIFIIVLKGLFEGLTLPSLVAFWRHWAPPLYRTTLISLAVFGLFTGSSIAQQQFTNWKKWTDTIYIYGAIGSFFCLLWWRLAYETPASHPVMSEKERIYFQSFDDNDISKINIMRIPWLKLKSSKPFYAIVVASFCCGWNSGLILNTIKLAFRNVSTRISDHESTQLAMLLSLSSLIPAAGALADYCRRNYNVSTMLMRKICVSGGFTAITILLPILFFSSTDIIEVHLLYYSFICALQGVALCGVIVNQLDISPRFASLLMGIIGGVATLATIIHTFALEATVYSKHDSHDDKNIKQTSLRKLFITSIVINIISGLIYAMIGSGENQSWTEADDADCEDQIVLPNQLRDEYLVISAPEEGIAEEFEKS